MVKAVAMDYTLLLCLFSSVVVVCPATTNAGDEEPVVTCECPWTQQDFISLTEEVASLRADVIKIKASVEENAGQNDATNEIPPPNDVVGNIVTLDNAEGPTLPPRPEKIDGFVYATCKPMPNSALTTEMFQPITGIIHMKQNISGGPLIIDVYMYGFQSPPGSLHGFHVHTYGDLKKGCQSTGGHFNPENKQHGGPDALERHVGDLGNISPNEYGVVDTVIEDNLASLMGDKSIIGRAFVIHAGEDDLGLGGFPDSLTTGHAGARLACCVIGISDK